MPNFFYIKVVSIFLFILTILFNLNPFIFDTKDIFYETNILSRSLLSKDDFLEGVFKSVGDFYDEKKSVEFHDQRMVLVMSVEGTGLYQIQQLFYPSLYLSSSLSNTSLSIISSRGGTLQKPSEGCSSLENKESPIYFCYSSENSPLEFTKNQNYLDKMIKGKKNSGSNLEVVWFEEFRWDLFSYFSERLSSNSIQNHLRSLSRFLITIFESPPMDISNDIKKIFWFQDISFPCSDDPYYLSESYKKGRDFEFDANWVVADRWSLSSLLALQRSFFSIEFPYSSYTTTSSTMNENFILPIFLFRDPVETVLHSYEMRRSHLKEYTLWGKRYVPNGKHRRDPSIISLSRYIEDQFIYLNHQISYLYSFYHLSSFSNSSSYPYLIIDYNQLFNETFHQTLSSQIIQLLYHPSSLHSKQQQQEKEQKQQIFLSRLKELCQFQVERESELISPCLKRRRDLLREREGQPTEVIIDKLQNLLISNNECDQNIGFLEFFFDEIRKNQWTLLSKPGLYIN